MQPGRKSKVKLAAKKSLAKTNGELAHCNERVPNFDSTFFGAFPSNRMTTATNNVNSHFFIRCCNSCMLQQRILVVYNSEFRELFEATKPFIAQ
jgi:hypothetical protein